MSLKHAILVLLDTEPGSGYDLLKHFNDHLGYFWNAKHQQIYHQLKMLHEEGLINCQLETQQGKPNKKIYSITDKGKIALQEWIATPVMPSKVNDALLVKLYGGHLSDPETLMVEIERHTALHNKTLANLKEIEGRYLAMPENQKDRYRLPYLTLRKGIVGEKAWLAWAQEVKSEISQMSKK